MNLHDPIYHALASNIIRAAIRRRTEIGHPERYLFLKARYDVRPSGGEPFLVVRFRFGDYSYTVGVSFVELLNTREGTWDYFAHVVERTLDKYVHFRKYPTEAAA